MEEKKFSVLNNYGEELTTKQYITNPAISRDEEIKKMILVLVSPEKSAILTGKPGIGKTALVEGLCYRMQIGDIPNALKEFKVWKINTSSLLGNVNLGTTVETKLSLLIDEIINDKVILFIDEIHTLVTASRKGEVDFINMLKPGLDRGNIKIIGATTTQEFEQYLITDKAFLRRFERIEIAEPDEETVVKILLGTVKKIEAKTGVKIAYTEHFQQKIYRFLADSTSEFKRVFGLASRYPDITLNLLSKAFSYAVFDNSEYVTLKHFYQALINFKDIYPDSIQKQLEIFKIEFADELRQENVIIEPYIVDHTEF